MGMRIFFLLVSSLSFTFAACPRFPETTIGHSALLTIVGDPKQFVPGSVYTVHLQSPLLFTELMLTSEAEYGEGSFQIIDSNQTSFSDYCLNTVVESNNLEKNNIHVLWAAPYDGCVNIKGAVKIRGVWTYTNKILCVLELSKSSTASTPIECCACDHARYKVIFEGLWRSETHPKDFPTELWLTHFSDIIGASHNPKFNLWSEGQIASYGFKQLAEYGVVRELETELRNQSSQLRSIIKAAGLWHPNLNGKTTAIFRVDPRRHLLTLASMFGPSPDWIVGISSLNLCLSNCSWLASKVIDLFPYDAGTDNGISYMSPNSPNNPQEKIKKITTMYPEDPRAPFYDPSGTEMSPLARLYISRESIIPKRCSDLTEDEILEQVSLTENTEEHVRPECSVTPYSAWTSCSVTCGKGLRMRSRKYLNEEKAKMFNCDRQLISKEMCISSVPTCPEDDEDEIVTLAAPGECDVTAWSEWSDCSVSCGIGFVVRTRSFTTSGVHKKCMHISTMEKEKCMLPPCTIQDTEVSPACEVSEWSEWSPCSVTCDKGQRVRVRKFKSSNPPTFCETITQMSQSHPCNQKKNCNIDASEAKNICKLNPDVGPCRGAFLKWHFNSEANVCTPFYYGGCRGNKNRFNSLEECNETCGSITALNHPKISPWKIENKPVNCIVSNWSSWSTCRPCPSGVKIKTRFVLVEPKNGGRPCPVLSHKINCSIPEEFCVIDEARNV